MRLSTDDFHFLARVLHRRSGLVLTPEKSGLFDRRIKPVLHRFGFKDLSQLVRELRLGNDSLAAAVSEAITINDTSFFRHPEQLGALRAMLPQLLARRADSKRLRIWTAACATGQEAYSLAMLLDEFDLAAQGWMVDLVATDLSGEAVRRAEKGRYTAFEVQRGLAPDLLARYFAAGEGGFTVCERLRRMVTFRRFNLLDSFGWLDDLDIVLSRNVLIYFDRATKIDILERMADCMAENALLLLGDAESQQGLIPAFRKIPGPGNLNLKISDAPLSQRA